MAKRKRMSSTENKIKKGYGEGQGIDYKPWINIQDVPSLGRATRLKGIKIPRQFEFLSDLERNYFYLLEYSDKVIDIREQYPLLPLDDTLLIAKELGLNHPIDPKTKEPIVMTTDFLVTMHNGTANMHVARTLKYKDELMTERTLEKFEIERVYWEKREIDWGIVTEGEVSKVMATNIAFVHSYIRLNDIEGFDQLTSVEIDEMVVYFVQRLMAEDQSVKQIARIYERDFGMPSGSGLALFKHLIITKTIKIDLLSKLNVEDIVQVKSIQQDFSEKVRAL
ncbi:transposase [Halolactibacillus alkaliphilus]|jgi:hypothetical protein|uniref:Transposase n=1 Tax=Halolactibacillus alkaliphilus TaxID=442899 RepID=A0A511X4A7_9BACI|nr:TnsA endonuclease N-terminal domain-containing protein [Halolactibacillus alkaliphilus]GEN57782.1 transposase [Halolactibacillus alkaliphilus]GGN75040.1 transposase [Halolactibacillus alkaliphilus]SFP04662.1 TnsA endonuclease C terminal [Halolactibacillus alkaliphilus]